MIRGPHGFLVEIQHKKYVSCFSIPIAVDKYRGSNTGPSSDDPFNGLHSNRFGLVPYPVESEWRRIIDLSFSRATASETS